MKITSLTAVLFLIAGAVGGCLHSASSLQRVHAHGMPMSLQDWLYDCIDAAIYGAVGGVVGMIAGMVLNGLFGRSTPQTANH